VLAASSSGHLIPKEDDGFMSGFMRKAGDSYIQLLKHERAPITSVENHLSVHESKWIDFGLLVA